MWTPKNGVVSHNPRDDASYSKTLAMLDKTQPYGFTHLNNVPRPLNFVYWRIARGFGQMHKPYSSIDSSRSTYIFSANGNIKTFLKRPRRQLNFWDNMRSLMLLSDLVRGLVLINCINCSFSRPSSFFERE